MKAKYKPWVAKFKKLHKKHFGNYAAIAREMGVFRQAVHSKAQKLGLLEKFPASYAGVTAKAAAAFRNNLKKLEKVYTKQQGVYSEVSHELGLSVSSFRKIMKACPDLAEKFPPKRIKCKIPEKTLVKRLKKHSYNFTATARDLNVAVSTVFRAVAFYKLPCKARGKSKRSFQ